MNNFKWEFVDDNIIVGAKRKGFSKYNNLFENFLNSEKKTCIITPAPSAKRESLLCAFRKIIKDRGYNIVTGRHGANQIYMVKHDMEGR